MREVSASQVRDAWIQGRELALLDLREEDIFAVAHPLFAANLPLSRLEMEILDRVPRRDTLIVLYDDEEGLVARAAVTLAVLGYDDVARLGGGLAAWRDQGFELFRDVNSPSKAFGELVEAELHTPSLPAEEVKRRLDDGEDLVVLDARRFDEYNTMSIPTGVSVPGAELVLRAASLAPKPSTTIIVNCAGRTRSLIGTQSLRNAGLPNPVFALRNGTIGWTLAGFALDHGQTRRFPEIEPANHRAAQQAARQVAERAGVRHIAWDRWREEEDRGGTTIFCIDVATPEEYAVAHLPGFRSVPGGQLVQETDMIAAVRGARILLHDRMEVRADMTASWLAQMGWIVAVLTDVPASALSDSGPWRPRLPALPQVALIDADDLAADDIILDLRPSPAFRRGHIKGAHFVIRARLARDLPLEAKGKRLVLVSEDDRLARFAAQDLSAHADECVVLRGGMQSWAPRTVVQGDAGAWSSFDDVYRRPYEGTDNAAAKMQAYLDWEFGLVEQLRRDGTHNFKVLS
jgi:rhodanese-related sulfurtransferase